MKLDKMLKLILEVQINQSLQKDLKTTKLYDYSLFSKCVAFVEAVII